MVDFLVRTTGHDFFYQIFEIIKVFCPDANVMKIEEKALVSNQSFFLDTYIKEDEQGITIEAEIREPCGRVFSKSFSIKKREQIKIEKMKKRVLKLLAFILLRKIFKNKKQPWGILTGIRPTKIVHELLDEGKERTEIIRELKRKYLVHREKSELLIDIAEIQMPYIENNHPKKIGIYISIPFCPSRCIYCSFPSNPLKKWGHLEDEYIKTLVKEISILGKYFQFNDFIVESIYVGGGTPTCISEKNLNILLNTIAEKVMQDNTLEFTVEGGRPDTITQSKAEILKKYNVNRVSINPQTINLNTLKIIGRNHSPEEVIKAFTIIRNNVPCINMDIIAGLPGETISDIERTMEFIKKLNPENITVHTLAIKKGSKLKEIASSIGLPDEGEVEKMIRKTREHASKMDMRPYYLYRQKYMLNNMENTGYSKRGYECIYNIQMMEDRQTIIGFGAGSITKVVDFETWEINRISNPKDISEYIKRIDELIKRKLNNDILNRLT